MWFIFAGVVEIAIFGGAVGVTRRQRVWPPAMPTAVRYSGDDSPAHTTTAVTQAA